MVTAGKHPREDNFNSPFTPLRGGMPIQSQPADKGQMQEVHAGVWTPLCQATLCSDAPRDVDEVNRLATGSCLHTQNHAEGPGATVSDPALQSLTGSTLGSRVSGVHLLWEAGSLFQEGPLPAIFLKVT